jgi:hypothetical protein
MAVRKQTACIRKGWWKKEKVQKEERREVDTSNLKRYYFLNYDYRKFYKFPFGCKLYFNKPLEMNHLPTEVLAQILIKVDTSTIYNLLLASQYFIDILDHEQYWKIRLRKHIALRPFNNRSHKWLYRCYLGRRKFKHDLTNTPWENHQSNKVFIGEDEGHLIYKEPCEAVMEEITANLQTLHAVEEQDRRFIANGSTGYYVHLKIADRVYFFRYAPYDALYVGIMFASGNIFIDFSPIYIGEVKQGERGEVFRDGEGITVFRTGHTFTKNDWDDEAVFITNDNPRLTIPATTVNVMMLLDEGINAWVEYCEEKNIDETWAQEFSESL